MAVKPLVAIVGRPNVGKSTLFNRITGKRIAIVEDEPGITRDRLYADADWSGYEFTLVDTGGIEDPRGNLILEQMRFQAEIAIDEADVIIFVVDVREGLTAADEEVAEMLRRTNKPVVLAANKVEQREVPHQVYDFYRLGLGDPIVISASQGMGVGDLLDEVVKHLPKVMEEPYDEDTVKVAVIGRPNVGKSSLVNALLGEERVIVSDIPGTTRDAIDTLFRTPEGCFVLIDTAGMRRKGRIEEAVERYSVVRSLRAIDRSDVVLMVIDATAGVTEQDKKIAGYAHEKGKASILLLNKWDLVEKDEKTYREYELKVREELAFMPYAPILTISAKTKQRVHKIIELILYVLNQTSIRVSTSVLNDVIEEAKAITPPPTDQGQALKIFYATQVAVKPPTFVLFVNDPKLMHFSYLRYLENQIRRAFSINATPVRLYARPKE